MLLGMIAEAERPHAMLAMLILGAVAISSGDRSTCDQPAVTTGPARCFWLHRNYEVPELIGTCDVAEIQSIRPDDRTQ